MLLKPNFSDHRRQYKILVGLLVGFIAFTGVLNYGNDQVFQRFLGDLHPLLIAVVISISGFMALSFLLVKGWCVVYMKVKPSSFLLYSLLILLFVSVAIWVDFRIVYPADMNVLFPESLLFYPAIGLFVEILFHLLPLTFLLSLFTSIFKTVAFRKLLWIAMVITAILEPTYHIYMDTYPVWAMAVVWGNIFFFNVTQFFVLNRYGFTSMYGLRMVYYLFWHIIWGPVRLELLF